MSPCVVLCVDEQTCRNPQMIGLGDEAILKQPWLRVYTRGAAARQAMRDASDASQAWVISCDDVEPINLAASMKADKPNAHICLVASDVCGSLLSRAHTAHIDEVLEFAAFIRRYADTKGSLSTAIQRPSNLNERPSVAVSLLDGDKTSVQAQPPVQASQEGLRLPNRAPGKAFVMSIVSGSGGAGKSAVSALTALISCAAGNRTLLLDCDLQFGDMNYLVGTEGALGIDTALSHPEQLRTTLRSPNKLVVLSAPERLEAAEQVVSSLPKLLDEVSDWFDVIVVNTGASWAEQHAALLERSSAALFLVDQRVSSVRACKHALDLCARCGIAQGPFIFALNKCAKGSSLTTVDVSCALQGVPVFELKDGGRDVEECLSSGYASDLIGSRNEFVKSLEQMLDHVLPSGVGNVVATSSNDARHGQAKRRARRTDKKRGRR